MNNDNKFCCYDPESGDTIYTYRTTKSDVEIPQNQWLSAGNVQEYLSKSIQEIDKMDINSALKEMLIRELTVVSMMMNRLKGE